jgi:hypothetical protein
MEKYIRQSSHVKNWRQNVAKWILDILFKITPQYLSEFITVFYDATLVECISLQTPGRS